MKRVVPGTGLDRAIDGLIEMLSHLAIHGTSLGLIVSRARLRRPAGNCGGRRWRRCSGNSSAAPSGHKRRLSRDRSTPACPTRRRGRKCRARASRPRRRAARARCTCQGPTRNSRPGYRRCRFGKIRSAGRRSAGSSEISSRRRSGNGGLRGGRSRGPNSGRGGTGSSKPVPLFFA